MPDKPREPCKHAEGYDDTKEGPQCRACGELLYASVRKAQADAVNHPKHYNAHPSGVECITVVEHMNFNRGNAIKYTWRAGEKDKATEIQDLEKARWYLDREIARLKVAQVKKS